MRIKVDSKIDADKLVHKMDDEFFTCVLNEGSRDYLLEGLTSVLQTINIRAEMTHLRRFVKQNKTKGKEPQEEQQTQNEEQEQKEVDDEQKRNMTQLKRNCASNDIVEKRSNNLLHKKNKPKEP